MICPKALAVRTRPVTAGCMRILASIAHPDPTLCLAQLVPKAFPVAADQRRFPKQIRHYSSRRRAPKPKPSTSDQGTAHRRGQDESEDVDEDGDDNGVWDFKKIGRFPRDQELLGIAEKIVFREDNKLSEPKWVVDVIEEADLKVNQLECIALPGRNYPGLLYPICRFINREQQRQEQKEKEKAARRAKVMTKEVEINWAITKHDLGHKLKQLLRFMQKGCQCEVAFQNKVRGKKKATKDEMEETVRVVMEAIAEVPGANEYKSADGKIGSPVYKIYWQATPTKAADKESPTAAIRQESWGHV